MIAWLFSTIMVIWLESGVVNLTGLYKAKFEIISLTFNESIMLLFIGALLGLIASFISVKQYLVTIEPK
ncbi:hypothetical protein [Psychromonas sp. KJ10-2]|uniref:hypothetical protein n=1 Tax=Psychromonas sp. KJ10-2 TaxID=3391822 RepID=UPI0039B471EF